MSKEEKIEELDSEEKVKESKSKVDNERKSHPILVTVLIVLLLCVFTAFGYALGGVKVNDEVTGKTSTEKNGKSSKAGKEELDINSRLVKFLYNEVTGDEEDFSCYTDWEYKKNGTNYDEKFEASSADENVKMQIVGKNLATNDGKWIDSNNVPNVGARRKSRDVNSTSSYYYTKDYVESLYKQIYGSEAVLDTSIVIKLDNFGGEQLIFDSNTQKYYPYYGDVGGTCGPNGSNLKLDKAYKEGNKVVIYQVNEWREYKTDADIQSNNPTITKYNFVYTFELENDGMYKFVSRVKENN